MINSDSYPISDWVMHRTEDLKLDYADKISFSTVYAVCMNETNNYFEVIPYIPVDCLMDESSVEYVLMMNKLNNNITNCAYKYYDDYDMSKASIESVVTQPLFFLFPTNAFNCAEHLNSNYNLFSPDSSNHKLIYEYSNEYGYDFSSLYVDHDITQNVFQYDGKHIDEHTEGGYCLSLYFFRKNSADADYEVMTNPIFRFYGKFMNSNQFDTAKFVSELRKLFKVYDELDMWFTYDEVVNIVESCIVNTIGNWSVDDTTNIV